MSDQMRAVDFLALDSTKARIKNYAEVWAEIDRLQKAAAEIIKPVIDFAETASYKGAIMKALPEGSIAYEDVRHMTFTRIDEEQD